MESEEASSSSTAAPRAGNQSQPDPESGKEKKKTYEEIACRCTNFRFRVHYPGGEEGSTIAGIASGSSKARENVIVELERDEERGESVVHLAQPRLALQHEITTPTTSSASSSSSRVSTCRSGKGKEREQRNAAEPSEAGKATSTSSLLYLRCLNCSTLLLTYRPPKMQSSSPDAPSSANGLFTLQLKENSLLLGSEEIEKQRKKREFSKLYGILVGLPPTTSQSSPAGSRPMSPNTPGTTRRHRKEPSSTSSSNAGSRSHSRSQSPEVSTAAVPAAVASVAMSRESSSASSASQPPATTLSRASVPATSMISSALNPSSHGTSSFHTAARSQIQSEKQEVEAHIIRIRAQHEANSQRYMREADLLASRAASASAVAAQAQAQLLANGSGSTRRGRTTSPAIARDNKVSSDDLSGGAIQTGEGPASNATTGLQPIKGKVDDLSPSVIQKGGFEDLDLNGKSPADDGPLRAVTSPFLSPSGGFGTLYHSGGGGGASGSSVGADGAAHVGGSKISSLGSLLPLQDGLPSLVQRARKEREEKEQRQKQAGESAGAATPSLAPRDNSPSKPVSPPKIAQPDKPQSPSMRRSRSPSPSRDQGSAAKTASQRVAGSRERPAGASRASTSGSIGMAAEGSASGSGYDDYTAAFGTSISRRPALDLARDARHIKSQTSPEAAVASKDPTSPKSTVVPTLPGQEQRGRVPAAAVLQSSLRNSPTARNSQANARRPTTAGLGWLRLNSTSPAPPAVRPVPTAASSDPSDTATSDGKGKSPEKQAEASDKTSTVSTTAPDDDIGKPEESRPSIAKTRHVSFKEPEKPSRRSSPDAAGTESATRASESAGDDAYEPDETTFQLDEELVQSDGEQSENGIVDAATAAARAQAETDALEAATRLASRRTVSPTKFMSSSVQPNRTMSDVIAATSFIGSRGLPSPSASRTTSPPVSRISQSLKTATRLETNEQARHLRESLGMDSPSHRGNSRSARETGMNPRSLSTMLREEQEASLLNDDDLTDEVLDRIAPIRNLATSVPIYMSLPPRRQKEEEYEFERKTSVDHRVGLTVPKLRIGGARFHQKLDGEKVGMGGLETLGEEDTPAPTPEPTPTTALPEL